MEAVVVHDSTIGTLIERIKSLGIAFSTVLIHTYHRTGQSSIDALFLSSR